MRLFKARIGSSRRIASDWLREARYVQTAPLDASVVTEEHGDLTVVESTWR
ncbi:MAG: hypothetical protein H6674_05275 [Dehalococcoidia bacterium]|nr:hypothetical protein [Dehalococcoidia bacterium]